MTALLPAAVRSRTPQPMTQAGLVALAWVAHIDALAEPQPQEEAQRQAWLARFEHAWTRLTEEDRPSPEALGQAIDSDAMEWPETVWAHLVSLGGPGPAPTVARWQGFWQHERRETAIHWLQAGWSVGDDPVGFTFALIPHALHWPGVWEAWVAHPQYPGGPEARLSYQQASAWALSQDLATGESPLHALWSLVAEEVLAEEVLARNQRSQPSTSGAPTAPARRYRVPQTRAWARWAVQAMIDLSPPAWEALRTQGGHTQTFWELAWVLGRNQSPAWSQIMKVLRQRGMHPNTPMNVVRPMEPERAALAEGWGDETVAMQRLREAVHTPLVHCLRKPEEERHGLSWLAWLWAAGADPNDEDRWGARPLHWWCIEPGAIHYDARVTSEWGVAMLRSLRDAGASWDVPFPEGWVDPERYPEPPTVRQWLRAQARAGHPGAETFAAYVRAHDDEDAVRQAVEGATAQHQWAEASPSVAPEPAQRKSAQRKASPAVRTGARVRL